MTSPSFNDFSVPLDPPKWRVNRRERFHNQSILSHAGIQKILLLFKQVNEK